ncbi:glutathione S-transferase [Planoprotostelium fungivorum]|uniref:Glutathione S-transferase n=1 Tax=Planoprotostelium fungivorum TaxID=1890364 RepID=A0A2P6NYZ3_9EUKA|nr:glutathione S-transferase [Planoprotostelium fungivorum]
MLASHGSPISAAAFLAVRDFARLKAVLAPGSTPFAKVGRSLNYGDLIRVVHKHRQLRPSHFLVSAMQQNLECQRLLLNNRQRWLFTALKKRGSLSPGASKDIDAELIPEQKGDTRAWQAYLEEKLYPCVVKERWLDEPNYTNLVNSMLKSMVWPMRSLVGWHVSHKVHSSLWAQGTARHSDDETPTLADIITYSFLSSSLLTTFDIHWNRMVLNRIVLVKYCLHMTELLFPEYAPCWTN